MALRYESKRHAVFSLEEMAAEPEAEMLIEEVVKNKERSRILHLCMGRLHRSYREALYLTYFEAVSYTHLDVYKRQGQVRIPQLCVFHRCPPLSSRDRV